MKKLKQFLFKYLRALGGVLVLEPGLNRAGASAFGFVTKGVFTVANVQRNKTKIGDAVGVPFLEPLDPCGLVGKVHFSFGDPMNINTPTFAQRVIALERLDVGFNVVDGLAVLEGGFVAVDNVASDGVRFHVVIEEISDFAAGSPGDLSHSIGPSPGEILGGARFDADVNSGGDVISVEGQFDADFGAQLPAQLSGDFGFDSSLAVAFNDSLKGDDDGQSGQEAHGQTQLGGETDVVLGQHAVLGDADVERFAILVLHRLAHPSGDLLLQFLQIKDVIDGTHEIEVKNSSAFVGRAAGGLDLVPNGFHGRVDVFAHFTGQHRRQTGHLLAVVQTAEELAENVLPNFAHVVIPQENLRMI